MLTGMKDGVSETMRDHSPLQAARRHELFVATSRPPSHCRDHFDQPPRESPIATTPDLASRAQCHPSQSLGRQ
jgi:hypothetical protein